MSNNGQELNPQGYNYGLLPYNHNPFWDVTGEVRGVNATVEVGPNTGTPTADVDSSYDETSGLITLQFGFDGLKGETGATGETGAQGPQGERGPAGANGADGITPSISASASVSNTAGTPAVNVVKTGTDAAPSFAFNFSGIKGEQGERGPQGERWPAGADGADGSGGVTPRITVNAAVDANTGTPSVEVSKSGTDVAPVFDFSFHNIKGETGPQGPAGANGEAGPQGPTGETGPQGATPVVNATASVDNTVGTPAVTVTKTGSDAAPSFAFDFTGLKGADGSSGTATQATIHGEWTEGGQTITEKTQPLTGFEISGNAFSDAGLTIKQTIEDGSQQTNKILCNTPHMTLQNINGRTLYQIFHNDISTIKEFYLDVSGFSIKRSDNVGAVPHYAKIKTTGVTFHTIADSDILTSTLNSFTYIHFRRIGDVWTANLVNLNRTTVVRDYYPTFGAAGHMNLALNSDGLYPIIPLDLCRIGVDINTSAQWAAPYITLWPRSIVDDKGQVALVFGGSSWTQSDNVNRGWAPYRAKPSTTDANTTYTAYYRDVNGL